MNFTAPTITAALATLAVAAAPAGADQVHAPDLRFSDVSAYGEDVVATAQTSRRSYALAAIRDGRHSWLNIMSSRHPYVADVSSDSQGNPVVAYSRADRRGDHDLYVYYLRTGIERKLAGSARGTDERLPSMYGTDVVFFRSGAGAKRNGIYVRSSIGPQRGKDRLIWRTSVARSTDIEDNEIAFETDVKVGRKKANGIYVIREDSRRPRLTAVTRTGDDGNRASVGSPAISGGYLHYLRTDSKRDPQHTVYRQLVDGTATRVNVTARPADAEELAVGGPRLLFTRSLQRGVHEISAPEWLGPRA